MNSAPASERYKQKTPHFRTYSRRALCDLPQTLHGDRARRDHWKRCHPFFDLIHSFSDRGQNVDFWLLSKNNTGSSPLPGNPAGNKKSKHHIFAPTAGVHCAIFPKLCAVIELVVPITEDVILQRIVFPRGCTEKIRPNLQTRGFSAITP